MLGVIDESGLVVSVRVANNSMAADDESKEILASMDAERDVHGDKVVAEMTFIDCPDDNVVR